MIEKRIKAKKKKEEKIMEKHNKRICYIYITHVYTHTHT